jgi:hypothetical protein
MLTVGVDLAAEFAGTAVAWLDWSPTRAVLRDVVVPADDDAVLRAVLAADKAGIDCPLGWPDTFVSFVSAHQHGNVVVPEDVAGRAWRRRLAYRWTDEAVLAEVGMWPLSVAADRIGHTAMRCAGLLARLARHGHPVDRAGDGVVVEVYPAASLRRWGLPYRGYKRAQNVTTLGAVVDELLTKAPWLDLGPMEASCRRSDHALDAVVAALSARAAALALVTRPDERQAGPARTEGWIAIPTSPLDQLLSPRS